MSAGAKVIVPARDHDKAATALEGHDGVEIEAMDLLDPASIDGFAEGSSRRARRCTSV